MKVIGIDPGSRACGYGIIESTNGKLKHITSGTIVPSSELTLARRLGAIYSDLTDIINAHSPDCMSVEDVFFAKNAKSAIKLGQARGVALLAASNGGMEIYEYAPTNIKLALTGNGRAKKSEVQKMVAYILGLKNNMNNDCSDAIATAICHINSVLQTGINGTGIVIKPGRRKRKRFSLNDINTKGKSS